MTSWLAHYGVIAVFFLMLDRRRLPGGERARDALRRRARVGCAHTPRRRARLARTGLSAPTSPSCSPASSATRSARSAAGGSATTAAGRCSSAAASGSTSRPSGSSRPSAGSSAGGLGGLGRADHAGGPLVHLDPGRRLRDALPPLQRADSDRQRDLVPRDRRHRLGARLGLGALQPWLQVRRVRRSGRDRRRSRIFGAPFPAARLRWVLADGDSARRRQGAVRAVDPRAQGGVLADARDRGASSSVPRSRLSSAKRPNCSASRRRSAARTAPTRSCSCWTRWGSAPATRSSARRSPSTPPPKRSLAAAQHRCSPRSTRRRSTSIPRT